MKKLLLALVLAGLWFNYSKPVDSMMRSHNAEQELKEKAQKAIEQDLAVYKAQKITGFYENEFKISLRNEAAQLAKFQRQITTLTPQSARIDDKNGAKVLELSQAVSKAREATARAMDELYMYLGPVKGQGVSQTKENVQ